MHVSSRSAVAYGSAVGTRIEPTPDGTLAYVSSGKVVLRLTNIYHRLGLSIILCLAAASLRA